MMKMVLLLGRRSEMITPGEPLNLLKQSDHYLHNSKKRFCSDVYWMRLTIGSYPGGKASITKHALLYLNIPQHIDAVIEPFSGLAHFTLALQSHYGYVLKKIWLNDKNSGVVSLLRTLKKKNLIEALFKQLNDITLTSKEFYSWKNSDFEDREDLAIQTMILLNCSFSGVGGGFSLEKANRPWREKKYKAFLLIHDYLKKARITNLDYKQVILKAEEYFSSSKLFFPFMYLDPPYYGIARRENLYFTKYNHIDWEELLELLNSAKYKWLLSSNTDPYIIDLLQNNFPHYQTLQYSIKGGLKNGGLSHELLIANYPLKTFD